MNGQRVVHVPVQPHGYDVTVGSGVRNLLGSVVASLDPQVVVFVSALRNFEVPELPVPPHLARVADGEHNKTMQGVERLCRRFARAGLTRKGVVVSCGGGTVTDMVGLAAALYHRGVPVVHLPTTLLAQVDASVGGKTGVNLPEGKNLVGTYWHPAAVLCDVDLLGTLPPEEWRNGFGELARCELVAARRLRGLPLEEQIVAAVQLKSQVVAMDERDQGARVLLNYGHTLGHALETASRYRLRHGESVAVGMIFAALLAGELGRILPSRIDEHYEVIRAYGLPEQLPAKVEVEQLLRLMARDKKALAGLTFVLDGPNGMDLVHGIPVAVVGAVLRRLQAGPGHSVRASGSR